MLLLRLQLLSLLLILRSLVLPRQGQPCTTSVPRTPLLPSTAATVLTPSAGNSSTWASSSSVGSTTRAKLALRAASFCQNIGGYSVPRAGAACGEGLETAREVSVLGWPHASPPGHSRSPARSSPHCPSPLRAPRAGRQVTVRGRSPGEQQGAWALPPSEALAQGPTLGG